MEVDLVTTSDKVYVGAGFLQEAGEVCRRGSSTDDGYGATAEPVDLCVLRAVTDEAGGWA